MARYRTIKPELFADEKLTACTVDARFCFLGLLPFCDDMGRKQYSPRRIKAEVFPADTEYTVEVVEALVQELAHVGVVELYDIGKDHYLRIPHFLRHQVINRPGHSHIPASPNEDPSEPNCKCRGCQFKAMTTPKRSKTVVLTEQSGNGQGAFTEDSVSTHGVRIAGSGSGIGSGVGSGSGDGVSTVETLQADEHLSRPDPAPSANSSEENPRTPSAALSEIAVQLLALLEIPPNSLIIQAVIDTIQVRGMAEKCSPELAAHKLAGRAAMVLHEHPPDSWAQWLFDARYDYVPQGDKRLNQRGFWARPVCGGPLCSEGWEPYVSDGQRRIRRCPDCVRAWRDQGEG